MKKIIAIILCIFCLVTLAACDSDNGAEQGTGDATEKLPVTSEESDDTDNTVEPSSTLSYRLADSDEWKDFDGKSLADICKNLLWEPGLTTYVVFKYEKAAEMPHDHWSLRVNCNDDTEPVGPFLPDVIDVYTKEGNVTEEIRYGYGFDGWNAVGTLTEAKNADIAEGGFDGDGVAYVTVALQMQATAGNEYMGVTLDDRLYLNLYVTMNGEEDSFDNSYDAEATFSEGN